MATNVQPCSQAGRRGGAVVDQQPSGLAVPLGGGEDGVEGLHEGRAP